MYSLLMAAKFDNSGFVSMPDDIAEPKLSIPNSGLYAQISNGRKIIWRSKSMLDISLPLSQYPGVNHELLATISLNDGSDLLSLAYGVVWETELGDEYFYTLDIAEDLDSVVHEKAEFQLSLWRWLGGTGLILLLAQASILRWSLKPLHQVAYDLQAIKNGDRSRLSDDYPQELNQLTENINSLLDHEQTRHLRYKNSLADLAHSLKTPLAVIRGELESTSENTTLRDTTSEQLSRLSELVDYQLQRAATEGQSSLQSPISLGEIVHKIVRTLDKVYQSKNIKSKFIMTHNIFIHADEGDMYELLGNVLENAYKYCNESVSIFISMNSTEVDIRIDDDGNGIPEHAQEDIIKRGKRIDMQIEGHGIGLAIVSDIVEAYRGTIRIERSPLGGARFQIVLPKT